MKKEKIGIWRLEWDPTVTREYYARTEGEASAKCGCAGCLNWEAVRESHFPGVLGTLLDRLGVAREKVISVRRVAPLTNGKSLYAGSYAVVGQIVEGPREDRLDCARLDVFDQLAPGVHVALRKWTDPPPPWGEQACVRLRFLLELPWLGDDPEAHVDLSACRGPVDRINR